jgi:hypothetical protein
LRGETFAVPERLRQEETMKAHPLFGILAVVLALASQVRIVTADVVTEANTNAAEIASTIRQTPYAVRAMALVQVSVFDAVQSISGKYRPLIFADRSTAGASIEAAVAAATRDALLATVPAEKSRIESDYQAALAAIPAGVARSSGIAAGEKAAAAVIAARSHDGYDAPNAWPQAARPGRWVPTALPLVPHWGRRTPWLMTSGRQMRPGPPPALDSEVWKRDLAEIAGVGSKNSTRRTDTEAAIARFWDTTSPSVYWPVVRCVAAEWNADVNESARLLAEAAIAMDDAMIAVFDAKYAYEFWRPITAIRNAAVEARDSTWQPLIETPMHPEYPCAHCIISATVGAVIEGEIGERPSPVLRSTSPTGSGMERTWSKPADFVREVSEARISAGVHFRNSTEVGQAMGRRIGELAQRRLPRLPAAERVTSETRK